MTTTDILDRLIDPKEGDLSPEAAQSILALQFSQEDRDRMQALARKANEAGLSAVEEAEAERYELIGNLLARLHSKARLSLQQAAERH